MSGDSVYSLEAILQTGLEAQFAAAGFDTVAASDKARLLRSAAQSLLASGIRQNTPARACFVPGRIELLGKHTDYAGGSSIVAATDRGFCFVACARSDQEINLTDAVSGEISGFSFSADLQPTQGHWSNYPMTVARRLARNFPVPLKGADMAFASDLPLASGMSSSSAFMIGCYLVLAGINHLDETDLYRSNITRLDALAGYLATIENGMSFGTLAGDRGVGTFGGSEDHIAILCSQPHSLLQYAYAPVRFESRLAMPEGMLLCVLFGGVQAEKTGPVRDQYNNLSLMVRAIRDVWVNQHGTQADHLGAILARNPDEITNLRRLLGAQSDCIYPTASLLCRLEHFYQENFVIIPAARVALASGDLVAFGEWVDRSQLASEKLLGNQIPETIFLAQKARELGAVASSAFGAGFGGSVWAMLEANRATDFQESWIAEYTSAYPAHADQAECFLSMPAPAAFML
jgi:galactokinase